MTIVTKTDWDTAFRAKGCYSWDFCYRHETYVIGDRSFIRGTSWAAYRKFLEDYSRAIGLTVTQLYQANGLDCSVFASLFLDFLRLECRINPALNGLEYAVAEFWYIQDTGAEHAVIAELRPPNEASGPFDIILFEEQIGLEIEITDNEWCNLKQIIA